MNNSTNLLSYKTLIIITSLLLGAGCVTPQGFDSQSQEENWWLCRPLDDNSWDCGDNDVIEEVKTPPVLPVEEVENEIPKENINTQNPSEEVILDEPIEEAVNVESLQIETKGSAQHVNADQIVSPSIPKKPSTEKSGHWMVQIGAFRTVTAAQNFADTVAQSKIEQKKVNGENWYRVYLGFYAYKQDAVNAAQKLKSERTVSTWVRSRNQ